MRGFRRFGNPPESALLGGSTAPLHQHQQAVADLMGLLATIEPDSGTPLSLHDDAAEAVRRVADRTGDTPAEVVTAALEWHLRHDNEPDPPDHTGTEP